MTKKKIFIWVGILFCLGALVFGAMLAVDYSEWSEYKDEKSLRKLEKFLSESSSNWFAPRAKQRIDKIRFVEDSLYNLVLSKRTEADCEKYLMAYQGKENRYVGKVSQKLDTIAFENANREGTKDAFKHYMDKFPNGVFYAQALELNQTTINEDDKLRVIDVVKKFQLAYFNEEKNDIVALCEPILMKFDGYKNISKAELYKMLGKRFDNFQFVRWDEITEDQLRFTQLPSGNLQVKFNADKTYRTTTVDEVIEMFSNSEILMEISKENYLITSYQETELSKANIEQP